MTYAEACAQLPAGAEWSSSFGHAGDGGYVCIFRTEAGERYAISNGPYKARPPFDWQCTQFSEANRYGEG